MMNETSRPDKPVMIYRKTAILQKNGIFAAVGVYSYLDELHAVASFDPKGKQHYRNSFETRTAAVTSFETSVATSRDLSYKGAGAVADHAGAVADHALVSARPTWTRINWLLSEGFTKGDLALRLGYKTKNLQIGRRRCLAITALKVEQFYNKIRLGDTA